MAQRFVLANPPTDIVKKVRAHLDAGWSWGSVHRRLGVCTKVWYRWLRENTELQEINRTRGVKK
jgi:hypothetical protein